MLPFGCLLFSLLVFCAVLPLIWSLKIHFRNVSLFPFLGDAMKTLAEEASGASKVIIVDKIMEQSIILGIFAISNLSIITQNGPSGKKGQQQRTNEMVSLLQP